MFVLVRAALRREAEWLMRCWSCMYGTLLVAGLVYLVWMMVAEYTAWRAYHGSSNDSEDNGSLYDR